MMTTEESRIITSLEEARHLSHAEYAVLLSHSLSDDAAENLRSVARKITDNIFGREVRVRGLIEITNVCRNNCLYCGLRKGNTDIRRYSLSDETILATCREGHDVGFRTFVLQGGENPAFTRTRIPRLSLPYIRNFPMRQSPSLSENGMTMLCAISRRRVHQDTCCGMRRMTLFITHVFTLRR